jgi:hypothetical protein
MSVVEESSQKIVLVDESAKNGGSRILLTVFGALLIGVALLSSGISSQAGSSLTVSTKGSILLLALFGGTGIGLMLYGIFRTHARVILDKDEGQLKLERVGFGSSRTVRMISLKQVRSVVVDDIQGVWQLEFELESGEILAPGENLNSSYSQRTLQKLAEKINEFLGLASPRGSEI